MIKKLLFLIAIPAYFLRAQNAPPIKITIYSNDSATTTQVADKPVNYGGGFKNLIKWNYCLIGRGVLMFNYERHLSNKFTFEAGAGITYADFFFSSYYEIGNFTRSATNTTSNSSTGTITTKSLVPNPFENSAKRIGFAIELSPRFYFEKDEFQGLYISPYISYRKYNYSLTVEETNSTSYYTNSRTFDDLYYTFLDIGGKMGYQYYFSYNDSFYYDFYIGFAYRSAHVNTLQQTDTQGGYYGGSSTTYSEYLQSLGLLHVMLGAKIGFAF